MIKVEKKPIIGTYHKTGTVLLKEIFNEYCLKTGLKIIFNKNFYLIQKKDLINRRSLAVIRHPYEIVVSGLKYHMLGIEDWTQQPMKDGTSYFEKINKIEGLEDKINFEAKKTSYKVIKSIYKDLINKNETLFVKLENFWTKESRIDISKKICQHLNLNIDILMPIIIKKSQKKHNATNEKFCHIWPQLMSVRNIDFIDSLIPKDTFEVFGYKKDVTHLL